MLTYSFVFLFFCCRFSCQSAEPYLEPLPEGHSGPQVLVEVTLMSADARYEVGSWNSEDDDDDDVMMTLTTPLLQLVLDPSAPLSAPPLIRLGDREMYLSERDTEVRLTGQPCGCSGSSDCVGLLGAGMGSLSGAPHSFPAPALRPSCRRGVSWARGGLRERVAALGQRTRTAQQPLGRYRQDGPAERLLRGGGRALEGAGRTEPASGWCV